MTRQEFERRMERTRVLLIKSKGGRGLCGALNEAFECGTFTTPADESFDIFKPRYIRDPYWLRDSVNRNDSMTQLERRLVFLESFKGFCDAHELWREW